jgi:acyl-CoA synthetase (AMP-forming)/AMP-acid ligase II
MNLSPLPLCIQHNAERFPHKPALLVLKGGNTWETVTYHQLAEKTDRLDRGLSSLGIQPGARAVLMCPPSVNFFALVFALLRRGIVPIMIDPAIGLSRVTTCLAECQPEIYFGSPLTHAIRRLWGWGRTSLRLNLTLNQVVARAGVAAASSPPQIMPPQAEGAIVFTSGSTGLPKGAIYTYENFTAQIEMLVNALQLSGDERDLPAFPLFAMIDCLLGVTAVIPDMRFPRPANVNPERMVNAIQSQRVDTMFASPAALARLARYGAAQGLRLPSLKKVITAGAPAPADVQEQFVKLLPSDGELFGIYGSTETLPVTIVNSREILQETRALSAQGAGVCIGHPVDGADVHIIPICEEALSPAEAGDLPVGEVGEIAVRGPAVTSSYVERQQANRLAKITLENGEVVHRMGDLGYFDGKGRLWYCGRKSQRVVTANGTLFTEMVEGIFNAHPLVYRTAIVGVEKRHQIEPILWVELKPTAPGVDRNSIRAELIKLAQPHPMAHAIQRFLFHPAFPTDIRHNSKIIREKLTDLAKRRKI